MIRVGVVGAGLIGQERLAALAALARRGKPTEVLGVYDASPDLCRKTASTYGITAIPTLDALLETRPDWIFVALPHDVAVPITIAALASGASVLLEKPMGRDMSEATALMKAGGDRLRIGFNYRFYEGIAKAFNDVKAGRFGDIISVDFLLGHGCSPGQEKTWKLNDERAGGGCLIDPGVHLLDLCLQLAPAGLTVAGGRSWNGFWKTGIEEDVSVILSAGSFAINLRVSIVHWRSALRMSICGTEGYGTVTGRNRSYGNQSYTFGPRWGWRSAPSQVASEVTEVETDGIDVFTHETEALLFPDQVPQNWPSPATASEGLAVMNLLDAIRVELNLRRAYERKGTSA
jgi:predicted dehydrogenase